MSDLPDKISDYRTIPSRFDTVGMSASELDLLLYSKIEGGPLVLAQSDSAISSNGYQDKWS